MDWQELFKIATDERIKRNKENAEIANKHVFRDGDMKNVVKSNNTAVIG